MIAASSDTTSSTATVASEKTKPSERAFLLNVVVTDVHVPNASPGMERTQRGAPSSMAPLKVNGMEEVASSEDETADDVSSTVDDDGK